MAVDSGITPVGKAQRVLGQRAPSRMMMMIGGDHTTRSATVIGMMTTTIGGGPRVPSLVHPRAPSPMMMMMMMMIGGANIRCFVLESLLAPRGPKKGPRGPKRASRVNFQKIFEIFGADLEWNFGVSWGTFGRLLLYQDVLLMRASAEA